MAEKSGKLIECRVCGAMRPHFPVGDRPEKDADGRVLKRMRCGKCGAHTQVDDDQHDDSQGDN